MSPERGDTGDWKNYRLWHLDRTRGSKPRRKYFKHGTSDKDGNGYRYPFDSFYPVKTKAQDIQRRKQAVRPRWKRREGPALKRGCISTFLFLGRSWEASCLSVWGEAGRLLVCLSGAKLGGFLPVSSMHCVCVCFPNLLFLSHR